MLHRVDVPGHRRPVHRLARGAGEASADGRPGDCDRLLQPGSATSRHHEDVRRAVLNGVVNYAAPTKQGGRPGQRSHPGDSGSSGGKPGRDVDKTKSAKDGGRGGGGRRRECWICHSPDHLSFECPDRSESDDDAKGGCGRSASRCPRWGSRPRKEKQSNKSTSAKDADSSAGGKGRDDKEASCSLVGVVEPTVSQASEAGEDFQAMAAAVQANPAVVLLDSGCSHHLMGTKDAFVDLQPSGDVKHGEVGKQVLIPDVLYVPGVKAKLLSASQLRENGVKLQDDGDRMLLVSAAGDVLGRATYTGRVLCTDLRPCSRERNPTITEVVALRAIVSATKSTPGRWHARLAHVGVDIITSSAKHEIAIGLNVKQSAGADSPCVSCVGGKLARHTFPDKGSDAEDSLAVVHIDLCGPFRVAAKDGSLYFLLLKDRKTRYVWVWLVTKKSDVRREFEKWLVVAERQTQKSVLMLRSDRGGEFLGKEDDAVPATDWEEARLVASTGVGLHGTVSGSRTATWGLHLGVSEESKGWELLDIADNRVVTTSDVVFYETMSLEVWKSEHGPVSGRTLVTPPTDTSTAALPLLAVVGELADDDAEVVRPSSTSSAPPPPPLEANLRGLTPVSASGDEGRCGASLEAPAKDITGGRRGDKQDGVEAEQQTKEPTPTMVKGAAAGKLPTGEQRMVEPTGKLSATGMSMGESTTGEKSTGTLALVQHDAED
ncbi:unnamed protein product [Closterium sp. Yama58-4]|nr:unnamed protein product [Closterium sp. Yama58-4]